MTDHAEEQAMELEALQAIYDSDLQEVTDNVPGGWQPHGSVYRVVITPQDESPDTEYPLKAEVVFAHTATYPDEPPLLKARGLQGLSDADVRQLQGALEEQVEANLGMAMIYTLIGVAQEWLNEKSLTVGAPAFDPEAERKRREAEEEARIAELRAHGTAVTPENFADWRARFEAELAVQRGKTVEGSSSGEAEKRGRLTGKQWFMQQEAMHREVEEPELEADEEDGEDEANFSESDEDEDLEDEEDLDFDEDESDDEELLDEMLAAAKG